MQWGCLEQQRSRARLAAAAERSRRRAGRAARLRAREARRLLSFALTLASGIALTQAVWGWQAAWIGVGLAALGVLIVIGATTSRRAMGRLQASGDASAVAAALTFSFIVRASLLIGIVFLMTVKPPLEESLLAIAAAGGVGVLLGMPLRRRQAVRAA